jgi:hypothetical protein
MPTEFTLQGFERRTDACLESCVSEYGALKLHGVCQGVRHACLYSKCLEDLRHQSICGKALEEVCEFTGVV